MFNRLLGPPPSIQRFGNGAKRKEKTQNPSACTYTHTHSARDQTHTIRPPNIRANRINYDWASSSLARYFGNNRRALLDTTDPKLYENVALWTALETIFNYSLNNNSNNIILSDHNYTTWVCPKSCYPRAGIYVR